MKIDETQEGMVVPTLTKEEWESVKFSAFMAWQDIETLNRISKNLDLESTERHAFRLMDFFDGKIDLEED